MPSFKTLNTFGEDMKLKKYSSELTIIVKCQKVKDALFFIYLLSLRKMFNASILKENLK